jgi:ABC-2 type transport system permease protein
MSEPSQPSSSGGAVRLVAGREIRVRLASKAFRITTVAMIVVVVGFILTVKLLGGTSEGKVGFTAATAPLGQPFTSVAATIGKKVTVQTVDQAAGEQQVRDGSLDALIIGTPESYQVVVKKDLSDDLRTALSVLARQVALNQQIVSAGGDPAAVSAAVESATFGVQTLEPARQYQTERLILGVIVGILVYLALMIYGQVVAQGVVEEKVNRIVETLLTTIRPWQLMLGKVAGIGLVGLAQLFVVVAIGVVAGVATDVVNFPASIAIGVAVWAVVWFLLGYVMYALLFASLGALVSRQEDVGGATAPVLMMIVIPYVLGISILPSDPENQFLAIGSLIPLFSPTLMPMRIAIGVAAPWEVILSIGLTIATIVVFIWLSGRIYGNAVLRTGSRVRMRDALRSAA